MQPKPDMCHECATVFNPACERESDWSYLDFWRCPGCSLLVVANGPPGRQGQIVFPTGEVSRQCLGDQAHQGRPRA